MQQQWDESVEIYQLEMVVDRCRVAAAAGNCSCSSYYLFRHDCLLFVGAGGDLPLLDVVLVSMVLVIVVERTLGLTLIWTANDHSVGQSEAPD